MAKDTSTNEVMKEERIACIRKSALKLFALRGYDNVRIQQIADECGCSHGLLYHYYSSKEDIFHDLMEYHRIKLKGFHLFLDDTASAKDQLLNFCKVVCDLLSGDEEEFYYFVMFTTFEFQQTLPPPPNLKDKFKKPTSLMEVLTKIIAQGQKDGTVYNSDPKEMAEVLYSTIRGLGYIRIRNFDNDYKMPDAIILQRLLIKNL